MDKYLTASEANKIAKENNEDSILENILEEIKEKAQKGEFTLITRKYGFGDVSYYTEKLSDVPQKVQQKVISKLEQLGYKAKMVVEERQFVDIYLKVEW